MVVLFQISDCLFNTRGLCTSLLGSALFIKLGFFELCSVKLQGLGDVGKQSQELV